MTDEFMNPERHPCTTCGDCGMYFIPTYPPDASRHKELHSEAQRARGRLGAPLTKAGILGLEERAAEYNTAGDHEASRDARVEAEWHRSLWRAVHAGRSAAHPDIASFRSEFPGWN